MFAGDEGPALALVERASQQFLEARVATAGDDPVQHLDRGRDHPDAAAPAGTSTGALESRRMARAAVAVGHHHGAESRARERGAVAEQDPEDGPRRRVHRAAQRQFVGAQRERRKDGDEPVLVACGEAARGLLRHPRRHGDVLHDRQVRPVHLQGTHREEGDRAPRVEHPDAVVGEFFGADERHLSGSRRPGSAACRRARRSRRSGRSPGRRRPRRYCSRD